MRFNAMRARIARPELIGPLWDALPRLERLAIATLQPHRDLSNLVDCTWQEIDERDRACLIVGFRRALGLGSLVEAALP